MSFEDLAHLVFENELLREKILEYVIRDDDSDQVSYANVRSCRLVNKAWMHSISRILRKRREPVFHFFLDEENSLSKSADVAEDGKFLDNFVSSVSGTSSLYKQIPTFSITIFEEFFRQENHESLLKCFSRCGSGLVDLVITFPDHGGSLIFTFPQITFSKLKNLEILFKENVHMELEEGEALVGRANGAYFLQLLLSGCKDLQSLEVRSLSGNVPLPYGMDRLLLPATLTSLKWSNFVLENKHYEVLVRNEFPKLQDLYLPIGATSLAHGLIFKILDNVKTTLTYLSIKGTYYHSEEPEQPTYFRLPVMENLKVFQTDSKNLKLEDGVSMLQNCVPNLHKLTLDHQTTAMFRKWTECSIYASVRKLTVRLVSENHFIFQDEYDVGFPSEMMRLVEVAFPNIQTLVITVCGTDLCGLKYAFQNLKTLQSLKVIVERSDNIVNSDYWDALLIGTPVEFGTALRTTRNFWKDVKFGPNDDHPSIKNLTELRKLCLFAYTPSKPNQLSNSLISDVAFQFAFLNMPKLKKIRLYGRFMVSSEMMEEWRNQSTEHCIKYCTLNELVEWK